jgi:DNA polymerase IV
VAETPLEALELAIGDYAGQLSRWAQGIEHAPVLHPAISAEPIRDRHPGAG